jgi:hypothetical protein
MPCPPYSSWLDLPNNIWRWEQTIKFLTVQLPPFSRHIIRLRSKYSQNPVLKHHQSMLFSYSERTSFRLCLVFCNKYWVLRWGLLAPPNPQAGRPPTVGSPLLHIQYIRSYPPFLEAVSSIRNPRTRHAVVTVDPLNWV